MLVRSAARQQAPVAARSAPTAAEMLQAARAQRSELRNQLDNQDELRREIVQRIQQSGSEGTSQRVGLEGRLKEVDARISALDKQLATADAQVATAAAVPGAVVEPPRPVVVRSGPPEEVGMLGGMLIFRRHADRDRYARRIYAGGLGGDGVARRTVGAADPA